jgi:hypothetical protein
MKAILLASVAAIGLGACTDPFTGAPPTPASVAAELSILCAGATAVSAIVAQDGQIIGVSANGQASIAKGEQLISVNCQALLAAIPVVAGVATVPAASPTSPLPVLPAATALVSAEREWAPKIGISPALLDKIVKHYSHR